jgi:hypothetical protein
MSLRDAIENEAMTRRVFSPFAHSYIRYLRGGLMSRSLVLSDRIYQVLLWAYPASFRREYGPHMTQVFRDTCRAELAQHSWFGLSRLWHWSQVKVKQYLSKPR